MDDAYYREVIRKKLPQSFVKLYEKSNHLHDWYLKDLYLANTGPLLRAYSAKGKSTLQLAFMTSGPEKGIMLVYKNLKCFQVNYQETGDAGVLSPTGFGRCLTSKFSIDEDGRICHELQFEDGTMRIVCESLQHHRIVNSYWD